MHDHGELARHRHERVLMTAFGRKAQAPRLHGAVLLRSASSSRWRSHKRGSHLAVATSRDVPVMIGRRPGLLAFRRQPKMSADGLRFGNHAGSSIAALKVSAATGPTPGMLQKRRHSSSRPTTCMSNVCSRLYSVHSAAQQRSMHAVVLPSSGSSATDAVTRVSKLARWIRRRHD
jgi:hypothetical protein